jgi:hypothetical protein
MILTTCRGPIRTGRILAVFATLQLSSFEAELSDAATAPSSHRRLARRADRARRGHSILADMPIEALTEELLHKPIMLMEWALI